MEVPEHVEAKVREAFWGIVDRDGDRVTTALRGLSEEDSRTAVALGFFVCGYVVNDIYREGPTEADLRELAQQIIDSESNWIDLGGVETVAKFLGAASRGDTSFAGVDVQDIVGFTFACGGHLLAAFREEDQPWWEYLNEIWEDALAHDPEG